MLRLGERGGQREPGRVGKRPPPGRGLLGELRWQAPGPQTRPALREIDTGGEREQALAAALRALAEAGLEESSRVP